MGKAKETQDMNAVEKIGILETGINITEKLAEIRSINEYDPNNKRGLTTRAKETKAAIEEMVEELVDGFADEENLEGLFSSMGKLGKYSRTNQVLIRAQRPDTLGIAGASYWKSKGYVPNGNPIMIQQHYLYVLNGSPAVRKALDENPLMRVWKWFEKASGGGSLGNYLFNKCSVATNFESLKKLADDMKRYAEKYAGTASPAPNMVADANEFYVRSRVKPVVRGISVKQPQDKMKAQLSAENAATFCLPPFKAPKTLVQAMSVIYAEKMGPNAKNRSDAKKEEMRASFIAEYEKWRKNFSGRVASEYIRIAEEATEARKKGEKAENPGQWPVVSYPSMAPVYAFEDVVPGPNARPIKAFTCTVKCDEELYDAVRDVFRKEIPLEEIAHKVPENLRGIRRDGILPVYMEDFPENRILSIVREWASRKCASMTDPDAKKLFRELYAHAMMSSMGMKNPAVALVASKDIPKEHIKEGIRFAYSGVVEMLKRMDRALAPLVAQKTMEIGEMVILQAKKDAADDNFEMYL